MSHREDPTDAAQLQRAGRADAPSRSWLMGAAGAVLLLVALALCIDFVTSARSRDVRLHAAVELTLLAVAVSAATISWARFVALRRRERVLARDLERARVEAERWRREASDLLRGLGAALDVQFERWGLSSAEREVALLLLKGLAHKEIAEVRRTSEKTVRQQALSVYRKAGLSSRAELSAFFLEDLLLPTTDAARASGG